MKPDFKTSLSFRQAVYTILVGTILAVLISGFLVYQDLIIVRNQIDETIDQLIRAVRQSAAQAAYEIDAFRAQGTVSGIFKNKAIKEIKIIDDFGTVLAHNQRPDDARVSDWLVNFLFRGKLSHSEPLIWGEDNRVVGEIQYAINSRHVTRDFIDRTVRTIAGTFLLVFFLAGAFTFLFYSFTIQPILRIAGMVSAVDTGNPGMGTIDTPKKHEHDELGLLASAINELIKGYSRSLAASKEAENTIRQNEIRYRLLFENSPLGILTINAEGKILEVNPKLLFILGSPSIEDTRRINMFSFPPLVEAGISGNFKKCSQTGETGVFETFYTSKWGRRFFMRYHVQPIRNESGAISAVQGLIEDFTDTKRLEEQLNQSQKMEAVGTLAGGISHDFNNILQAITGYTQILLFDKNENEMEYSNLISIKRAAERAAQLVRQLMLFSRRAETEFHPLDLNQEVERARGLLERTIPKMIEIIIRPGVRLWNIDADQVQIEQILLNLGNNAADAMPDGGKLVIETENITVNEDYPRNIMNGEPGRYVLLTVSDTGHGMAPETIERIFEPFFTTKGIGKGTGLGLASVYGIVKNHGGYINCHSEVGRGTSFKIHLPAIEQVDAHEMGDIEMKPIKGGTDKVLLVDDEESIRDFASQALIKYGYSVEVASTGEEALEIYSRNPGDIDLVVMDLGMPGMGGYKCLQEIMGRDPSAKVVIASGYSVDGQAKKALEVGAAGYVGKPYQLKDLLEKVRTVLDEAK